MKSIVEALDQHNVATDCDSVVYCFNDFTPLRSRHYVISLCVCDVAKLFDREFVT